MVAQVRLRNAKALEYLVTEHGERLISIIRKHLFTLPHLQQECLCRTVQAVWDHVASFRDDNDFENWIGSVARYCCLQYLQDHQEEATIAWLIQKEIIEEKEMMATCLRSEERQVFYQLMEFCHQIFQRFRIAKPQLRYQIFFSYSHNNTALCQIKRSLYFLL